MNLDQLLKLFVFDAIENNIDKIKDTYFCENGFYKGRYIDPFKDHDEEIRFINFWWNI